MKYKKENYIQVYGELFEAVQKKRVFNDSKTFVDSIPNTNPQKILQLFSEKSVDQSLKEFVEENFELPSDSEVEPELSTNRSMEEHIRELWKYLKRDTFEPKQFSSLIPIPQPYIIPGGRFREIYYWDSFFTMQGLLISGELETAENMLDNFAFLIDQLGHIPNGNRVYYITRSQPPFFAAMIDLLSKYKSKNWQLKYIDQLREEYNFWMNKNTRLVKLNNNDYLNRYYDSEEIPREESYFEDYELTSNLKPDIRKKLFRNIRAACESGWDFSSRWFEDKKDLSSCITIDILPVDLNSLLFFTEKKLSELYSLNKDQESAEYFKAKSEERKNLINRYFWKNDFYFDFNFHKKETTPTYSLAAMYPLFFQIASSEKAEKVSKVISKNFSKPGGVVTTLNTTGQQWDAPNGWPPLQWMTIIGLRNYGFNTLADEIKSRWLKLNSDVFERTGKMFEKYNVEDISLHAGGGEYDLQDGFGWTNGVALALTNDLDKL